MLSCVCGYLGSYCTSLMSRGEDLLVLSCASRTLGSALAAVPVQHRVQGKVPVSTGQESHNIFTVTVLKGSFL